MDLAEVKKAAMAVLERINNDEKLYTNIAKLAAEGALAVIKDLEAAAGDCPISVPEPGSDMAKMLSANVMLRRQRDELKKAAVVLMQQRNEARASAMGYGSVCIQEDICDAEECEDILGWKKEFDEAEARKAKAH